MTRYVYFFLTVNDEYPMHAQSVNPMQTITKDEKNYTSSSSSSPPPPSPPSTTGHHNLFCFAFHRYYFNYFH